MTEPFDPPTKSDVPPTTVPALLLLVSSGSWFLLLGGAAWFVDPEVTASLSVTDLDRETVKLIDRLSQAVTLTVNALVFGGALHLLTRRHYGLARLACGLACLPFCGPCYLLAIPVGIWGLVVLRRPEVRASFTRGT